MIDINTYISNNICDMLDKSVIMHCDIHDAFTDRNHIYYTFESIGLFKGCKEIIKHIADNYDLVCDEGMKAIDIYASSIRKDLFFTRLTIWLKAGYDAVNGYYTISDSDERWNDKLCKFDEINITVNNTSDRAKRKDVLEILTHELTHAWDDYVLHKDGNSLYNKKLSNKFEEELKNIASNIQLSKWTDTENISVYDQYLNSDIPYIRQILYYLDESERHAYTAQITQSLEGKHFNTTEELVKYLNSNCVTYYNYKYIYNLFHNTDYVNELVSLGFKRSSVNKFKKISAKCWTKVINHIYHILHDHDEPVKENVNIKIDSLLTNLWER